MRTQAPRSLAVIAKQIQGEKWSRPTTYHGVEFRSYLESRFAFHLDQMGETWRYEPRRIGGYLPDFEITSAARRTFVEVKPTLAEAPAARERMEIIWNHIPNADLLVVCAEECTYFSRRPGGEWRVWHDRWRYE